MMLNMLLTGNYVTTAGSNICAGKGEMGNYSRNLWVTLNLEWSPTVYRNSKNIVTFLPPVIQIKNLRNKWKFVRSTFDFTLKDSSFRKGGKLAVYTTECSWMRPRLREEDLVSVPWSSIVHGRHFCKFIEHISNVINLYSVLHWPVGSNECERGQFKESPTSGLVHPVSRYFFLLHPAQRKVFISIPRCCTCQMNFTGKFVLKWIANTWFRT